MTDERRAALVSAGLCYDEALARMMGNEALLERVLRKFPADASYSSFAAAMSAGDYKKAEEAVHTLKGLSANLGFNELSAVAAELMTRLRTGETTGLETLSSRLGERYAAAIGAVEGM